jgi:Zn-dependent protease
MAARQRNLDVGLPTFIPFVGAWIELKEQPMDAETEAFVGLAGPMLGSFAAYVLYLVSLTQEPGIWTALAYAGFMLNLFNLIPLSPLDGGRIVSVISSKLWFLGVPVLIAAFVWHPSPMLLIVALLSAPHLWTAFKERNQPASNYHQADKLIKVQYGLQYICLVIFLAVLSYNAHENLSHVRISQGT